MQISAMAVWQSSFLGLDFSGRISFSSLITNATIIQRFSFPRKGSVDKQLHPKFRKYDRRGLSHECSSLIFLHKFIILKCLPNDHLQVILRDGEGTAHIYEVHFLPKSQRRTARIFLLEEPF